MVDPDRPLPPDRPDLGPGGADRAGPAGAEDGRARAEERLDALRRRSGELAERLRVLRSGRAADTTDLERARVAGAAAAEHSEAAGDRRRTALLRAATAHDRAAAAHDRAARAGAGDAGRHAVAAAEHRTAAAADRDLATVPPPAPAARSASAGGEPAGGDPRAGGVGGRPA